MSDELYPGNVVREGAERECGGGSGGAESSFAAPHGYALFKKINDAYISARKSAHIHHHLSQISQMHFCEGQADAFKAVLSWLDGPNAGTERLPRE